MSETAPGPDRDAARRPLSRDLVLRSAVALADQSGIDAVSMRRLGQELGVEAMSLYHHVDRKDDLLGGMVETVVAEINQAVGALRAADPAADWRAALRARVLTARGVMLQHTWAAGRPGEPDDGEPRGDPLLRGRARHLARRRLLLRPRPPRPARSGQPRLGFSQELFDPSTPAEDAASRRRSPSWRPSCRTWSRCSPRSPTTTPTRRWAGATTRPSSSSGWTWCSTAWNVVVPLLRPNPEGQRRPAPPAVRPGCRRGRRGGSRVPSAARPRRARPAAA